LCRLVALVLVPGASAKPASTQHQVLALSEPLSRFPVSSFVGVSCASLLGSSPARIVGACKVCAGRDQEGNWQLYAEGVKAYQQAKWERGAGFLPGGLPVLAKHYTIAANCPVDCGDAPRLYRTQVAEHLA
jgi:hypothetical protein